MKCPEQYNITQFNIRTPIMYEENSIGESHLLMEKQSFGRCYEKECMAYDPKKKICLKYKERK